MPKKRKPADGRRSLNRLDMPRNKRDRAIYKGIEWLACWMLDNVEGEEVTEEQLRPWAVKAWEAHLKRHIDELRGRDQRQ
jgi:hypothetical protein